MQANKSKNTKPELLVRARLREAGYTGYRLHWKKAPGKPDILLSWQTRCHLCEWLLLASLPPLCSAFAKDKCGVLEGKVRAQQGARLS